ncbi:recombinase family protein [Andreprevotia chitinilytica]|uniref:recombinase family protein n=1 Tax=Andreprevotia chitinilytica TaxID=396808 RepID=UPI003570B955
MSKTAIIYGRVSTAKQADDGLPIASQIEQGHAKAAALEVQVLRVFTDEGISGRSAAKRPAFQDAINYCAAFDVDYFICWSTSRFARNKIDAGLYKKALADGGTKLVYVSTDIDEDTDEGWFAGSLLEIVDEHYSRMVSRDTSRSMMKNARDGYFNGGRVPFGYHVVLDGKRRRLAIKEPEAQTIRDMFALCLQGLGSKAISMALNEDGQRKNGKAWEKNTVSLALKNPVYAGLIVFNRTRADGSARPEADWIVTESHPAIVTRDVYDRVQQLMLSRSPRVASGSPHSNFVFTGILRCGECGAAMQIESATGRNNVYHYYNCRSSLKGAGCSSRRLPAKELDLYLTDVVLNRVLTPERVREAIHEVHQLTSEWNDTIEKQRAAVKAELKKLQQRRNNLFELLELHGKDTPNLGDLTTRLRELGKQIAETEKAYLDIEDYAGDAWSLDETDVIEATQLFRGILADSTDNKKKREFFSSILEQVSVIGNHLQIDYRPLEIVNRPRGAVHSETGWLPDLGSNQGHTD